MGNVNTSAMSNNSLLRRIKRYFMGHSIFFHIVSVILWVWTLSLIFMLIWGFLVSVTPYTGLDGYANNKGRIFPKAFDFSNYLQAFSVLKAERPTGDPVGFWGMLVNSVWLTFGYVFINTAVTVMFAYAVARYKNKYTNFLYIFVFIQMMIPSYGAGISTYEMLDEMQITNTPLYLITSTGIAGTHFLIVHSYYSNISHTYDEAAKIEGANYFQIFTKIMLPMARPCYMSIFITKFIGQWNDYSSLLLYMEEYPTLSLGLYLFESSRDYAGAPIYFAAIFIAAVPISILFLVFNKMLLENLTIGGIKG